jgi:serine palmitoyltransferase
MRIARDCLNLGSYNYLGFADDWNATCQKPVLEALDNLPVSCSASRYEAGTTIIHKKLERLVVRSPPIHCRFEFSRVTNDF